MFIFFYSSDGRLSESDQILAINGQRVDAVMSHQEAINLLQQTTGIVVLIVARGGIPNTKDQVSPQESINSSTLSDTSLNNQVCPQSDSVRRLIIGNCSSH